MGRHPCQPAYPGKVDRESGCGSPRGATKRDTRRPSVLEGFVFSESSIDRDTIRAFRETEYHVFGDSPFTLRIGELNPALAAACEQRGAELCAYITACNPNSNPLDDQANAQRHALLRRELKERNLAFIEGEGKHPSNGWPGEASFLIFGIDLEMARALSRQLQQDAFVWASSDLVPQLILLR